MTTASDYHRYARECLVSASKAVSETERQAFIEMARKWTQAAMQIEADAQAQGDDDC